MTRKFKSIAICPETYDRLTAARISAEMFDSTINRLLDEHDERVADEIIRLRTAEESKQ